MVFSSLEFLFLYLPVMLLLYFMVPKKHLMWRNLVLLVTSLIFYGWGEPVYVFLMMATIAVDYVCGYLVGIYREDNPKAAKQVLIASIIINLGILGFFKYYNFFIDNLKLIPGLGFLPTLDLELPIGISFYTFQALSYVIDVYRGDGSVQKNVAAFGAYVTLYPQLIAGPIVRYHDVDEMLRKRSETVMLFASGMRTFCAGLAKKILLANVAGQMWNGYLAVPVDERTVVGAWIGMLCYTAQIYFDFSGYSDMAIGLGKMLGFRFLENFNYPYIAKSITDFWRRWHISLSSWFREYVYIPLGGNRKGQFNTYRNLLIVWFLTGFWHGASWNYILWGLYYFVLLVFEKTIFGKLLPKLPTALQHLYTMFFVIIGWLLFVFEDLSAGMVWLGNMFGVGTLSFISQSNVYDLVHSLLFFAILVLASTPIAKKLFYRYYASSSALRWGACIGCGLILVITTAYLVDSSFNPFLYFRF